MQQLVRDKGFYRNYFGLMIPMALQSVVGFAGGLADTMMVGGYSESALAAISFVNQLQFVLAMLMGGVGEGVLVMNSQYWGQKNLERIKQVTSIAFYISLAVSLVVSLASLLFPAQYLSLFGATEEVTREGVQYMRIMSLTFLLLGPVNVLLSTLRSVEKPTIGFIISASTLAFDIFFNYVLIYGKFGFPQMGAAGAAVTTAASKLVDFILLSWYLLYKDERIRMRVKDFLRFSKEVLGRYLRTALPLIGSGTSWGIAMWVQTFFMSRMGMGMVSASNIAASVSQLLMVFVYGGAGAANVVIGKTIGEKKQELIKPYTVTLQVLFLAVGLVTGLLLFFSRHWFLVFYESSISPDSLLLANQLLIVLSVTGVGTAYQMSCLTGIVRGGGDTKFVLYNDIIFMWGMVLPLSFLCTFVWHTSPLFLFIVLKSDQITKCLVAVVKVNRYRWIREMT